MPILIVGLTCLEASSVGKLESKPHAFLKDSVLIPGEFHYLNITLDFESENIYIVAYSGNSLPESDMRSAKNYYRWEYNKGVWSDVSSHDSNYIDINRCSKTNNTYSFYIGISKKVNPGSWTIKIFVDNKEVSSNSLNIVIGDFCLFFSAIAGIFQPCIKNKNFLVEKDLICNDREKIILVSEKNIDGIVDDILIKKEDPSKKEETNEKKLDFSILNDTTLTKDELVKSTAFTYPRSKLKEKTHTTGSLFFDKILGGENGFCKNFFVILLAIFLILSCISSMAISPRNNIGNADITIINVQSYPVVGGTWAVKFTTMGCADLTISAVNGTSWSNSNNSCDLRFLELKCGNAYLDHRWLNNSVFVENYSSNETGYEISKVLSSGIHILKFQFGDDIAYAFNDAGNWWNMNWSYRKLVTVNSSLVDGNLINFPILVNITDSDLASKAQDDGDDIAFVLYSDNSTKLNHEIELFNGTTGELVAWVNVTSLSSAVDTKLWMYYGNSGCSNQQNPTGVWNSNYLAVWHMNLSSNTVYDSTSNNNDGTNDGCEQVELGVAGYALDFVEANTDYVNIGAMNSIEGKTYVTFEIYFKCDGTNSDDMLIGRSNTDYAPLIWRDETASSSGRTNTMSFVVSTGTRLELASNSLSDTNWHYFAGIFDGNNRQLRGYLDGSEDANSPVGGQVAAFPTTTADLWLGAWGNGYWHEGKMTEVRVSDVVRNASWISTTYNTIHSPTAFITIGEEEVPSPEVSNPSPSNGATNIAIPPSQFNITINDPNGNNMNITWRTNATGSWKTFNTTTGGGTGVGNGTYTATNTSWVTSRSKKYWWSVNLTNGYAWTNETYTFTTSIPPDISNPTPNNGSICAITPICKVKVSDENGGTVTVRFYENTTGSWVLQQINNNIDVTNPTFVEWDKYNNATLYDTKYWWKVNVSDGKGCYDEEIYYFTTSSDNPPELINENPTHASTGISTSLATINVTIIDDDGDPMDWSIETSPDIGDNSSVNANNGSILCSISGLSPGTTYTWYANVTDGIIWTNETYTFTTNYQPTITLIDPSPNGSSNEDIFTICKIRPDDNDGELLDVTWATNSSGLWVNKHTNNSVSPNNIISYQFTDFDEFSTTYYWKVFVDDGSYNVSRWYYFSTTAIQTSVNTIVPYEVSISPKTISASGSSGLDNVTLWYRYASDNNSWWWDDDWNYRRTITIDYTKIDSSLVNFPVLVKINSTIGAKCDNGDSIRFIGSDGSTEYYYEIEEWSGGGDSYVWVNVTYISSTQDTAFFMYYNNSGASDNQNPTNVWDSNFEMVHHMVDDTTSTILDSTSNNHDGTKGAANNPAETTGKISKGQDFSSDQISCGDLRPITAYTAECWIKADALGGAGDLNTYGNTIMASATNGQGYPLWLTVGKGGSTEVTFRAFTSSVTGSNTNGANLNTVDRFYIVATATISSTAKVYVNGVERLSFTADGTSFTDIFTIGDLRPGRAIYFDGMIDEVRISSTIRNTSWINASYRNQNNVTSFLTTGTEQSSHGWMEWNDATNPDIVAPWSWTFVFPNGTGYYQFYSIGKKTGSSDEPAPTTADAICYYNSTANAPVINTYDLRNNTGSKLDNVTGVLDVNKEYRFSINITDPDGWTSIDYINITSWYDFGDDNTTYNQTLGGNLNFFLQYKNTTGTAQFLMLWPDDEVQLVAANCTQKVIDSDTRIINISFKLGSQIRWAASNNTWNTSENTLNDNYSWNFNISVTDQTGLNTWVVDEYGVYKFASVLPQQNWVDIIAPPGLSDTSNVVTITYSSNYDFNMSIYFEGNLTNATSGGVIPIANNVYILANADLNDDILADKMFLGIGEANSIDIFNNSGIFSKNNSSQTVSVQFNVYIPFGTPWGKYTARVATKIKRN